LPPNIPLAGIPGGFYLHAMNKKGERLFLGAHVSISGGVYNAFTRAEKCGCDTIQIFVKSSNQWAAKPFTPEELSQYHIEQKRTGIKPVIGHASYLINVASPDEALRHKSRESLLLEIERCEKLAIPYLVLHPGSYTESDEQAGMAAVVESLDWVFDRTAGYQAKIALETTAGQGTNLGYRFEQLAEIIAKSASPKRLAVCVDTCHIHAAGYDISSEKGYKQTMDEFERIIGFDKLAVIHLNDTQNERGSKVDRHHHIGQGQLGEKAFRFIMQDKRFRKIPKILETPKGDDDVMDKVNLDLLRKLALLKEK